jgi:hypothetical protein
VLNWNAAEQQLGSMVMHAASLPDNELRMDHPKLVDFAIRRLAALDANDAANQKLKDAASWFGLAPAQVADLRRRAITDVRGLATAIRLASVIDRVNQRRAAVGNAASPSPSGTPKSGAAAVVPGRLIPKPIPVVVSPAEADQLRQAFGAALQARYEQNQAAAP